VVSLSTFKISSFFYAHSFELVLVQVFKVLLAKEIWESPRTMAHYQLSLQIFLGGVGLISSTCIALITNIPRILSPYCLTLASRFVLNHHPLLLKVMAFVDNCDLPFQQHLLTVCDLLFPLTQTCIPHLEWFHVLVSPNVLLCTYFSHLIFLF
jgi:hypothetical protein